MQKQPLGIENIQKIVGKKIFLPRLVDGITIASHKIERNKKVLFRNNKNNSYI